MALWMKILVGAMWFVCAASFIFAVFGALFVLHPGTPAEQFWTLTLTMVFLFGTGITTATHAAFLAATDSRRVQYRKLVKSRR